VCPVLDPCLHESVPEPVRTEADVPGAASIGDRPLAAITILLIGLVVYVLLPVLAAIVLGGFYALVVQRPFEWLVASLGGRRTVATWIMTLGTLILLFAPLGLLLYATVLQAIDASQWLAGRISEMGGVEGIAARLPGPLGGALRWLRDRNVLGGSGGGQIARYATQIASSTGEFLAESFFAMVTIYYLLLRGPSFVRFMRLASPLRPAQTDAFVREFKHVALGLFWGNVVTAVFHGVASAIGYAIFGVPNILLLGALTALASFIPVIGTATVWIPIVAALAISGSTWSAIGLLVYCIVVVGGVDNVLRPLVSKGHMALPNLLVFLTLFGGLQVWGMKGLILGPLVGSLAMTALRLRVDARAAANTDPQTPLPRMPP
jgi:predicted PurR-regulated permease PerM